MSDSIPGIKHVPPTYPVKPTQPGAKDRKSGERKRERPTGKPKRKQDEKPENSDDRPTIDEYV